MRSDRRGRRPRKLRAGLGLGIGVGVGIATALLLAGLLGTAVVGSAAGASTMDTMHAYLIRADPGVGDTVHDAPSALRLWFSEPIEVALTSVQLTGDAGAVSLAPARLGRTGEGEGEGEAGAGGATSAVEGARRGGGAGNAGAHAGAASAPPVEVGIRSRLAPGSYTVTWRTVARDGHPSRGEYQFTLTRSGGGSAGH